MTAGRALLVVVWKGLAACGCVLLSLRLIRELWPVDPLTTGLLVALFSVFGIECVLSVALAVLQFWFEDDEQ